jgi:hypothetical protein
MVDAKDISFPPQVEAAVKDIGHWQNEGKGGDGSALLDNIKKAFAGDKAAGAAAVHDLQLDVFDATTGTKGRKPGELPASVKADLMAIGGDKDGEKLVAAFAIVAKDADGKGKATPSQIAHASQEFVSDLAHEAQIAKPLPTPGQAGADATAKAR